MQSLFLQSWETSERETKMSLFQSLFHKKPLHLFYFIFLLLNFFILSALSPKTCDNIQNIQKEEYPSFFFNSHYYQIFIRPDGITDIIQDSAGIESFSRNNIFSVGPFISGAQFSDIHGIHLGKKIEVTFNPSRNWERSLFCISKNNDFSQFQEISFKPHTIPGDRYSWFFHYNTNKLPIKKTTDKDNRFYIFYWQPMFNQNYIHSSVIEVVFPIIYNPDHKQIYHDSIFIDKKTSRDYGRITFFQTPWQHQYYLSIRAKTTHSPYQNKPFYLLLRKDLFSEDFHKKISESSQNLNLISLAKRITESEDLFSHDSFSENAEKNQNLKITDKKIEEEKKVHGSTEASSLQNLNSQINSDSSIEEENNINDSQEKMEEDITENDTQTLDIDLTENSQSKENTFDKTELTKEHKDNSQKEGTSIDFSDKENHLENESFLNESTDDSTLEEENIIQKKETKTYEILKLVKEVDIEEKKNYHSDFSIRPHANYLNHIRYIFFIRMNESKIIHQLISLPLNYSHIQLYGYSSDKKMLKNEVPYSLNTEKNNFISIHPKENYEYYVVILNHYLFFSLPYQPTYNKNYFSVLYKDKKTILSKKLKNAEIIYRFPMPFQFSLVRNYQSDFIHLFPVSIPQKDIKYTEHNFSQVYMIPEGSHRIIASATKIYAGCAFTDKTNDTQTGKINQDCFMADNYMQNFRKIYIQSEYKNQIKSDESKIHYSSFPFSEIPSLRFSLKVFYPEKNITLFPIYNMQILFHDLKELNLYPNLVEFFYTSMLTIFAFLLTMMLIHPIVLIIIIIIYMPIHLWILQRSIYEIPHNKVLFPHGFRFIHFSQGILFSYNAYFIPIRYLFHLFHSKKDLKTQKYEIRNKSIMDDPPLGKNSIRNDLTEMEACIITSKLSDSVLVLILYLQHTGQIALESLFPFSIIKDPSRQKAFDNYFYELINHLKEDQMDLKFLRKYLDMILSETIEKIWTFNYMKTQNFYYNKFQTLLEIYRDLKGNKKVSFLMENFFWLIPQEEFRKNDFKEAIQLLPASHKLSRFLKKSNLSNNDFIKSYEDLKGHISMVISMINIKDIISEHS